MYVIKIKRRTVNVFKFLSILLIIVFVFFVPKVIQKLIKIKKIECISQFGECPKLIINSQIEEQLKSNILVNDYLIQYKIPDTLKIEVNLKKAKYAIFGAKNKYYILDKNGLIIEIKEETSLPILVDESFVGKLGQIVDPKKIFLLQIIEKVNWLYSVNRGKIGSNHLLIVLKDETKVFFPLEGDVDLLVGSLRLIFSRLNDSQEGIKMREIDLRFRQAILR